MKAGAELGQGRQRRVPGLSAHVLHKQINPRHWEGQAGWYCHFCSMCSCSPHCKCGAAQASCVDCDLWVIFFKLPRRMQKCPAV